MLSTYISTEIVFDTVSEAQDDINQATQECCGVAMARIALPEVRISQIA